MRFMGTPVHRNDLREAKVGAVYFVVREARKHRRPKAAKTAARLQSLPPTRLGLVEGLAGHVPAVRRELLGLAQVRSGPSGKALQLLTGRAEELAHREAQKRQLELKTRISKSGKGAGRRAVH